MSDLAAPLNLSTRLRAGETVFDFWTTLPHPAIIQTIARAGFRSLTCDFQHGVYDFEGFINVVAAVLVPLVIRTTSHQRDNAEHMVRHGAALHLPQTELSAQSLADRLQALDRAQLQRMATAARTLAKPQAAARVADELESLVKRP